MKLVFGADHGGYILKDFLIAGLRKVGHEVIDFGVSSPEAVDYPDLAHRVASSVLSGESQRAQWIRESMCAM